ncbi:MAG: hypothetical protein ABEJ40_04440 [Haloarculaceae archaeon]
MEEVAAVRRAALDAVGDVEPEGLRDRIRDRLDDGSLAPGVLAVLSARAVHDAREAAEREFPVDAVADRGAGVQLIYEGLRLTRTLVRDPPWERGRSLTDGAGDAADVDVEIDAPDVDVGSPPGPDGAGGPRADEADLTEADMAVLVADVLVARGFYLLARTEAAGDAVATVQSFGRDQTVRRTTGDASLDRNLEADVFELAAVAGTTAVGGSTSPTLREYVSGLAHAEDGLPLADGLFTEATVGELEARLDGDAAGSGGVPTSADS